MDMLSKFADEARNSNIAFPEVQANLLLAINSIDLDLPNIPKLCADFTTTIEALGSDPLLESDGELERSLQELQDFKKSWVTLNRKGLGKSLSAFRNAMALGPMSLT